MTEVEVFAFAEQFLARGMAVFLFDGPGQGLDVGVNPLEPRGEWVARAIVRFLAEEARVDSQRLGYFGVSFGGYLALRVALHLGQAFRCVVNFSGGPRVAAFEQLPRRLKADFQYAFMAATADDMPERLRALELNAPEVWNTDLLSIHGAQDDIFPLQALERFTQTVDRRHTLRVYPAEAHVCLNYLNECTVELADWVANKLCPSELALTVAAE
jgi:dienelactone hydrolase